jgi:hypothetical protein
MLIPQSYRPQNHAQRMNGSAIVANHSAYILWCHPDLEDSSIVHGRNLDTDRIRKT